MMFGTHMRRVAVAGVLMAFIAIAAGAFTAGFAGALLRSVGDPRSAPTLRLDALSNLESALGEGGFLGMYPNGSADSLQLLAARADRAIEAFRTASLTEADRDRAATLRDAASSFRKAARSPAPDAALREAELSELKRAFGNIASLAREAAAYARRAQTEPIADAFTLTALLFVFALCALAATLLAGAWYMRTRLNRPVETLRSSINGAAAGAMDEPVWGISRRDEIGGIARAAERLRQAAVSARKDAARKFRQAPPDPADAEPLELTQEFPGIADSGFEARTRIEAAGMRAVKASQMALDAAAFARETSTRVSERAETTLALASAQSNAVLGALTAAVERLSETAARIERSRASGVNSRAGEDARIIPASNRFPGAAADFVIEDLLADLAALERFAQERHDGEGEKTAAIAATLMGAIGRLNAVTDRLSSSAGERQLRTAS